MWSLYYCCYAVAILVQIKGKMQIRSNVRRWSHLFCDAAITTTFKSFSTLSANGRSNLTVVAGVFARGQSTQNGGAYPSSFQNPHIDSIKKHVLAVRVYRCHWYNILHNTRHGFIVVVPISRILKLHQAESVEVGKLNGMWFARRLKESRGYFSGTL